MRTFHTWMAIALITCASTVGEVTLAHAMQRIGDLGALRARSGLWACVRRVATNGRVYLAVGFMTVGFFSLLLGLSWADLSLVGPAAAALTFITNAFAAKYILREHLDRRRWIASIFVATGVALLTL